MASDVTYGRLASTNVLTDFVELPSQLMEHWFREKQVLEEFAKHFETNESVPDELLQKLKASEAFNQGFDNIEYVACALLDMSMHQIEDYSDFDLVEFEKKELERLGMPKGIVMRHRPAHFLHMFATNYYAAGYYVYLWAGKFLLCGRRLINATIRDILTLLNYRFFCRGVGCRCLCCLQRSRGHL